MRDVLCDLLAGLEGGTVAVIDLSQPLSERTPVIALPAPFANSAPLSRRDVSRYDERGPDWAWSVLTLGEHTGTHFDAPVHWISGRDGEDVASVPVSRLVGPAVVVDVRAEVAADPGHLLTADRLDAFEAEHGPVPPGAWLLLRTGWSARGDDPAAFLNIGPDGPVSPGPDPGAVRWMLQRRIAGFGTETVGTDAGAAAGFDPPMPAHHLLLGAGAYGLAQLANLDRLPPTGAIVIVAPLRLVDGTGSPARVLALA